MATHLCPSPQCAANNHQPPMSTMTYDEAYYLRRNLGIIRGLLLEAYEGKRPYEEAILAALPVADPEQVPRPKTDDEIKRMDITEFCELGFLQEVNRRFFHPCGLALEVTVEEDGTEHLSGIWDYRDDPEGVIFNPGTIDQDKINQVDKEISNHVQARVKMMGVVTQNPSTTFKRVRRRKMRFKTGDKVTVEDDFGDGVKRYTATITRDHSKRALTLDEGQGAPAVDYDFTLDHGVLQDAEERIATLKLERIKD